MFDDFYDYNHVLELYYYSTKVDLLENLKEKIIKPSEKMAKKSRKKDHSVQKERRNDQSNFHIFFNCYFFFFWTYFGFVGKAFSAVSIKGS